MNGMSSKSLGCFFCWLAVSLWQENSERALLEKFKKDWQEASRIMEWFLWHELNRSVPVKPVDDRLKVLCPGIKHHCFQFTKVLESNLAFICMCLFIYRQVLFQLLPERMLYWNFVPRRSHMYWQIDGWWWGTFSSKKEILTGVHLAMRDFCTDQIHSLNLRNTGKYLFWTHGYLQVFSYLTVFNGAWRFQSLSSFRSPNLTLGSFDQATDGKNLMSWQRFFGVFVGVHKASLVFWNDGGQWP